MESILKLISNENFSKLIGAIILLISCLLVIVSIFKKDLTAFAQKALGAILIIGIILFSNNILTYSIAVIVIGTLIAESKFLESIWATALKNKDYFASNATDDQKRKKVVDEINSEAPISIENTEDTMTTGGNLICIDSRYDEKIKYFIDTKDEIGKALVAPESGFFKISDVNFDIVISNSVNKITMIDCIAKGKGTNYYCIEIKQSCSLSTLDNIIGQLRKDIKILKKYYTNKNIVANVKGILIVAENCDVNDDFYNDVLILKYDKDTKSFFNREKIEKWI